MAGLPLSSRPASSSRLLHRKTRIPRFRQPAPSQPGSELESQLGSELESRVLAALKNTPLGKSAIATALGQRQPSGPLHVAIRRLVEEGALALTLPDKPSSRLQKYRLTPAGKARLAEERRGTE